MLIGAMAGLGAALVLFLALGALGIVSSDGGQAILVFVQFLALFVAGYVAGRFSGGSPTLNGGVAGLLVLFVSVAISVAAGAGLGVVQAFLLGVVAAVLGSAGGVLSEFAPRRR